jgi:alkylation response protein AidB-like acyl-CoA dehydrogenase
MFNLKSKARFFLQVVGLKANLMLESGIMDEESKRLAEELLFSGKPKPSFAKWLFFGVFDADRVMPYPEVSVGEKREVDELVVKVQAFMDRELDADEIDRQARIPDKVIRGLGELGILSLTIPKAYGGLGMSQYAYCRVMEEVAKRCAATALFINAHQSVGLKALLLFGTEEQKKRWLPPLGEGRELAAFALTEPNAGSDAGGLETTATWDPTKKVYRISGKKQWITNGSIAAILTVMAKVDGKVTAFLTTPDMPGFKVTAPALEKVGMRGSITSNLEFDNVEVPEANILGPKGGGLKVCLTVLDYGRTTFGATCTGMAKACVQRAYKHAKSRHQFKRPLSSFALVKEKLAKMSAYLYAMEASVYLTAGLVDRGGDDFMLESAIVKVFSSEASWQILYDTMQIFGGRSFFTDHPFERMMRDARLNMIGEGSNDVLRVFIAAIGLRDLGMGLKEIKEALYHPIDEKDKVWNFIKFSKRYFVSPKIPIKNEKLKNEALRLASNVRHFGIACTKALAWHGEAILEKQLVLNRLATLAIALYTASATLCKMDAEGVSNDGRLYLLLAHRTVEEQLKNLLTSDDRALEQLSDEISDKV